MVRITELYEAKFKTGLEQKLQKAESVEEAGRIVRESLSPLIDPEGEFQGSVLLAQSDTARRLVDQVFRSSRLLQKVLSTEIITVPVPKTETDFGMFGSSLGSGILAALFARFIPSMILSVPAGAAVGFVCYVVFRKHPTSTHVEQTQSVFVSKINPAAILEWIKESFEDIDRILADTAPKPLPPDKTIDKFGDLISLFQDLLAEVEGGDQPLPKTLAQQIQRITNLLRSHGIEARNYDAATDGASPDSNLWEVEYLKGIADPRTLSPVFIKDGKTLRMGRVLFPEI